MMETLLKLLLTFACELLTLWLLKITSDGDRAAIIELGYRSKSKMYKKPDNRLPLWDRVLHWSLCKEAKQFKASVWVYFAFNLFIVAAAIGSVILACVLLFTADLRSLLLCHLKYLFAVIIIHTGIRFFPDLFLLPSEQKRYGITKEKKKR